MNDKFELKRCSLTKILNWKNDTLKYTIWYGDNFKERKISINWVVS